MSSATALQAAIAAQENDPQVQMAKGDMSTPDKLYRFKLLFSVHHDYVYNEDGTKKLSGNGKPLTKEYKVGDTITSATDLAQMFGPSKFQPIDSSYATPTAAQYQPTKLRPTIDRGQLEKMRVDDLLDYACNEEIELNGATKKDDIINEILKVVGSYVEPKA